LAIGLAAREAIHQATGLACDLKWPNDLLLRGRKCAGILVVRTASAVIAGIGVNVNQSSFPAELAASATSLRMESGVEYCREDLLVYLLAALEKRQRRRHAAGVGCGQQ
jgi:BirA family biotin operon repressor/biotin-[acetyl-CoA-carboxylase] ligase